MYISIVVGIIFIIILIIIILQYQKYRWMKIKLVKGNKAIEEALNQKEENLIQYINILKEKNLLKDEDITLTTSEDIKEKDEILRLTDNKIENIMNNHEKVLEDKDIKKIRKDLHNTNIILNSHKKYYNENVNLYNKLITSFPSNIVGKLFHYKEKEYLKKDIKNTLKILDNEKEKSQ